jgi:hypothetical protein
MEEITQQDQAQESAKQMADRLMNKGLKCYCVARRWYGLWIPWARTVVDATSTQTIKRIFGMTDAKFVRDFVYCCLLECEPLQVSDRIARQYPMPTPAPGEKYPSTKDMMKWAQTILMQINK